MKNWTFFNPVKSVFAQEIDTTIADFIGKIMPLQNARIGIITGANSSRNNGSLNDVIGSIQGLTFFVFDKINPEPYHKAIMEGKKFVEDNKINIVIGLGGGSSLDASKAISCIANSDIHITKIMDREIIVPKRLITLIAIPTTAGTGSEVTPYSVLTNEETNVKKSVASPNYYPDLAILTPKYLKTVPKNTIADVGIDSLAHAFEALWSIHTQPVSEALSFKSIKLIKDNLLDYYQNPNDETAASNMLIASNIAGFSFSNTFTAACHGLSFPIGERFKLTHGHSCAMTLHLIADINKVALKDKFDRLAKNLGIKKGTIPLFIEELRNSVFEITKLSQLNADSEDLKFIAANAFKPLLNNNPVSINEKDIIRLLEKIM